MAHSTDHETGSHRGQLPSAAVRIGLSVGILLYLLVVLLGPLSNPIGSENLTLPLGRQIRPVHEALYLGHGYRFFAPDPGPSHILEYRINAGEPEKEIIARFPDRNEHWPRLLYHRWFMLSETLYTQCSTLPELSAHRQTMVALSQDIDSYRQKGELRTMKKLVRDRDVRDQVYKISTARRDALLRALGEHLLSVHSGESIELYLLERLIPRPYDVQSGVRLNDPRFQSEPRFLARFTASDFESQEETP